MTQLYCTNSILLHFSPQPSLCDLEQSCENQNKQKDVHQLSDWDTVRDSFPPHEEHICLRYLRPRPAIFKA